MSPREPLAIVAETVGSGSVSVRYKFAVLAGGIMKLDAALSSHFSQAVEEEQIDNLNDETFGDGAVG